MNSIVWNNYAANGAMQMHATKLDKSIKFNKTLCSINKLKKNNLKQKYIPFKKVNNLILNHRTYSIFNSLSPS